MYLTMAGPKLFDRVKDTSTTTGVGTLTLANSAPTGFRTFGSVLSNLDTCLYAIVGGAEWEVGIGTYTVAGTTLARTTVLASSNAGAAVNLSAGTKDVFIAPVAEQWDKVWNVTDTVANLAAYQAGRIALPSNGFSLYRDTGSALNLWGPLFPFTAPISGDFAWINQDSATIVTTFGGVYLEDLTPVLALRIRKKAAPATPFTITAAVLLHVAFVANAQAIAGLVFRQSSDGKCHQFGVCLHGANGLLLQSSKLTDADNFSAHYLNETQISMPRSLHFLRIADNGTNRICSYSADGQNWIAFHTVGRTDFLTADEVGFFVDPLSTGVGMTLLSWKEG